MLEDSAKAMLETLKGVLALYLTFDTNRDITGISREGSRYLEWNAITARKQSILRVVDNGR